LPGCLDAALWTPATPENRFSPVTGGAYDPSVVTGMPAWREVQPLVSRELGEPVSGAGPLVPARRSGMTWAARAQGTGAIVVKLRYGDRAYEKTQWCAAHLPALGARGYPVPAILWHGMISSQWHVTVQNRLPGRPLYALDGALDGPMLDAVLRLTELQADAGIPAGDRDFTGYVANVLFDDWDQVWADAPRACAAAGPLCARLRRWLQPVWGLRLPAADYAHNDLNLPNVLTDGARITGVVDWDEFGLGSRAGPGRLPCDRRARVFTHERQAYGNSLGDEECAAESAILDRLAPAARAVRPSRASYREKSHADMSMTLIVCHQLPPGDGRTQ
jgi:hypothetical protein